MLGPGLDVDVHVLLGAHRVLRLGESRCPRVLGDESNIAVVRGQGHAVIVNGCRPNGVAGLGAAGLLSRALARSLGRRFPWYI